MGSVLSSEILQPCKAKGGGGQGKEDDCSGACKGVSLRSRLCHGWISDGKGVGKSERQSMKLLRGFVSEEMELWHPLKAEGDGVGRGRCG